MAQQPLWHSQTIKLSEEGELLLVQVWSPTEVTLKRVRKTESGSLATVSVLKFPLSHARFVGKALMEVEKEVSVIVEIKKPLNDLFENFPRHKVEEVFEQVRKSRIGTP